MNNCTPFNCKCPLFDKIGICQTYGTKNINQIYKLAEVDFLFRLKLENLHKNKDSFPINDEKNQNKPLHTSKSENNIIYNNSKNNNQTNENTLLVDNFYDNIIVDEIDRLNPLKCPVHRNQVLPYYDNYCINPFDRTCIGCRIGISEKKN